MVRDKTRNLEVKGSSRGQGPFATVRSEASVSDGLLKASMQMQFMKAYEKRMESEYNATN